MEQTLTKLRQNSRVSVIGGGISGLSFAYFLGKLRPDIKITLYEKDNRVGGYINTAKANKKTENDTGLHDKLSLKMEKGPRTLRGISSGTLMIVDLLNKFNKLDQLRGVHSGCIGNKKYLLRDVKDSQTQLGQMTGELIEVPGPNCGLETTLNFFFSNYGKIILFAMIKDFFFKQSELDKEKLDEKLDNMSVEEFCNRHFGNKLINEIGSALMYGIYAADSADLNVNCVMKGMVDLEKYKGSIIKSVLDKNRNKNSNDKDKITLDKDIQLYVDKFGTELNLLNLSKLLKKFPMLSLTEGLSVLCEGIRNNLPSNVNLKLDEEVKSIIRKGDKMVVKVNGNQQGEEFDHVRSTINSSILGRMIGDDKISEKLKDFKYTSVTVCNVLIPKRHIKKYNGFGFLVPKVKFNKQARVMGVIFDSDVEENSSLIFPEGNKSIPTILKYKSEFNQENITEFEKNVINNHKNQEKKLVEKCTKVTLMLNIDRKDRIEATNSKLRKIVEETFTNILGFDLTQIKNIDGSNWSIEKDTLWDSIPLYDVEGEGFIVRKRELLKMIKNEPLSLGGMTFARGVGVPDNVVSSMKAAVELGGI